MAGNTFYHGTSIALKVGDLITPPNVTNMLQEKGRKKNLDKVFFTADFKSAKIYAGRAKSVFGGSSVVYEVEPIGEMTTLNEAKGTSVYFSNAAKIVKIAANF